MFKNKENVLCNNKKGLEANQEKKILEMCIYTRYITIRSNKFIKNLETVGSTWGLKVPFSKLYSMFPTCL